MQSYHSASSGASSTSPEPGSKRKLKGVDRGAAACTECRKHKIRCHPADNDEGHVLPCTRCAKRGFHCEFLKHNRGRKKRIPDFISRQAPQSVEDDSLLDSPGASIPIRISQFPFLSSSRTSDVRSNIENVVPQTGVSLQSMLDNDGNRAPRPSGNIGGSSLVRDPVQEGLLTPEQGQSLFNLFMLRFNSAFSLLDPEFDSHDDVKHRSSFLYTAILCISSRYLATLGNYSTSHLAPHDVFSAHQQIVVLARDHLTWAFAEAASTLDIVRAIAFMSLFKEPDDDKPCFYFNRAVLLARELDISRTPNNIDRLPHHEAQAVRSRQRVWLNLFMANTVFHLQFNQPIMIDHFDPMVVNFQHWLRTSRPATLIMDTVLACSVDLRRKCLHYRSLLQSEYSSALALAVLTRSMNEDWELTFKGWAQEIARVSGNGTEDVRVRKARVWASGLQLNLNLLIVNQSLRIPPGQRLQAVASQSPDLPAIPAFHHCLSAATSLLTRVEALDKDHISYAADTLLHFSLYAATLLWTLCRTPQLYTFNATEILHCRNLILQTATALSNASIYPADSPALHAKYLRRLCADNIVPPEPNVQLPTAPEIVPEPPTIDLDILLADFPWQGMEPPWNQVDGLWLGSETDWGPMMQ